MYFSFQKPRGFTVSSHKWWVWLCVPQSRSTWHLPVFCLPHVLWTRWLMSMTAVLLLYVSRGLKKKSLAARVAYNQILFGQIFLHLSPISQVGRFETFVLLMLALPNKSAFYCRYLNEKNKNKLKYISSNCITLAAYISIQIISKPVS